jgi:Chitobiase/beta-hexosaminidase C-terminal domain
LRYRFLALDPADLARYSAVKEWTAKLRLKYQLHNRGDHFEVELLALPKSNGISIRYTTDGSSPINLGFAIYDGPFRVPEKSRIVCGMAVCSEYNLSSEPIRIVIPQRGQESRPPIDPRMPARWNQQTRLDDSGAVWEFIQRLEMASGVRAYDIGLTADSSDGFQNVEYSGVLVGGYDANATRAVAEKLQEIVGGGSLRLAIGSLGFPAGQALLDWLKATNQPFNAAKVTQ